MTDLTHKFKVGQTVDLIHSTFRAAARGSYLIVGPGWKGTTPKGIKKVSHSEIELMLVCSERSCLSPPTSTT